MKKKYFIGAVVVLVIAALGISKLHFLSSPKANDITIAPAFEVKHQNVLHPETKQVIIAETKQNFINDMKSEVNAINKFTDQMPTENAPACDNCIDNIDKLIQILNDHSKDNSSRKDSAKALIKSGTKEGVLSVLKAIIDAHVQEDYDFKDSLIPIFADVDSVITADILTDVLTRKTSFSSDLVEIPEDIAYAIKNAIRLMPNEVVGESLAQKYHNAASEKEKTKLLDIKHPVMIARLATDAFGRRDNETAVRLMEELTGGEDNSVIMGIMMLAREKTVNFDNAMNILSSWNFTKPDKPPAHFILVEYLGNAEFSPEERSLAAHAMASEKDKEMAISALKKAQLFEEDPFVKKNIEDALSRIIE